MGKPFLRYLSRLGHIEAIFKIFKSFATYQCCPSNTYTVSHMSKPFPKYFFHFST